MRRVAVGKNRQSDVLKTDSQVYKLDAQIKLLESQLSSAMRDLASSAGVVPGFSVSGSIVITPPVFKREDIRAAAARRLEIKTARENVTIADLNVEAAMGGHLPTVYLEGNYRFYPSNSYYASTVPHDRLYGALTAQMPLYQGGTVSAKVKQAESVKRQAELLLSQTTRAVEQDITNAYETWDSSVMQTDAFKRALVSAEQNYIVTMNDYRLNLVTILDVITALTLLQSAKSDYETAVLTADYNRILLAVAINEFADGGLSVLKNASDRKLP